MDSESSFTMDACVTLRIPRLYVHLAAIRAAVLHTCKRAGLADDKAAQLEMAVDEACSNIIEHSYGGENSPAPAQDEDGLLIKLIRFPDRIVVEIFDRGAGFDFDASPAVSPADYLDERRQRGLGLFIIRCFVDSVAYDRATPDGNRMRLTKLV